MTKIEYKAKLANLYDLAMNNQVDDSDRIELVNLVSHKKIYRKDKIKIDKLCKKYEVN